MWFLTQQDFISLAIDFTAFLDYRKYYINFRYFSSSSPFYGHFWPLLSQNELDNKFIHCFVFLRICRHEITKLNNITKKCFFEIECLGKLLYFIIILKRGNDKEHSVWKSQKKSHSKLRVKRATFYILSGQKFIKNAKNGPFWRVFENLKLAVKQCYQTGQF